MNQPSGPTRTNEVLLVASGDLRQSANKVCWPAQAEMEVRLTEAFAQEGAILRRAHPYMEHLEHGFIFNQRMGMDVFATIDPNAPLVVAEAVWQYSNHVLAGLNSHRGPILTVANWSGQWPGLVGMLNLNGCLYKSGVQFSTLWSKDFTDDFFRRGLRQWLQEKRIDHDLSHVHELHISELPKADADLGVALADELMTRKAIIGVFDEGCMGMYNAIIEDYLLHPTGIYKERLSQSALVAEMREVSEEEAQRVRDWLDASGLTFRTGKNEETDLTDNQILEQCKMYIAALRIADQFGCEAIGIQYQQGLKDMAPASDLVEGLLNNAERPPAYDKSGKELYAARPLPHFNEVDECAGLDAVVTNRVWSAMQLDPATTLHDVRWGESYQGDGINGFVWLFQISGAAPASHFIDGYKGAVSERQPPMYFRLGGGTLKGICKPGEIIWSRVFVEGGKLHADLGRATVVALPLQETERRWKSVTSQWPIMHAMLHGVSRDQFMARHHANHLNVAYVPSSDVAKKALAAKAAMMLHLGIRVNLCGTEA
ncbi:putative L-fucose isomerase [Acidisarcina polymorpha]|uniref:Putative L-fucose isomerase n=1 Tax=Acidisarcina polymorpha TaxID=2211140 RepID=A0A2Z5G6K1_9BACT|nr:fucose isomerase [Acidisarcina polymorpha]AXC14417.1 putative L-fucose isomerase [Acidisarcina polymorpha]